MTLFPPLQSSTLTPNTEAFQSWLTSEFVKDAPADRHLEPSSESFAPDQQQQPFNPAFSTHAAIPRYLQQRLSIGSTTAPSLVSNSTGVSSGSEGSSLASIPTLASPDQASSSQSPMIVDGRSNDPTSFSFDETDNIKATTHAPPSPKFFTVQPHKRHSTGTFAISPTTHLPIPKPPQLEEMSVQPGSTGGFPFPQMPRSPSDATHSVPAKRSSLPVDASTTLNESHLGRAWESAYDYNSRVVGRSAGPVDVSYQYNASRSSHFYVPVSVPANQPPLQTFSPYAIFQPASQHHHHPSHFQNTPALASTSFSSAPPSPPPPPPPQPPQPHPIQDRTVSSVSHKRRRAGSPCGASPILAKAAKPNPSTANSARTTPRIKPSSTPAPIVTAPSSPRHRKAKRETVSTSPPAALHRLSVEDPEDEFYLPPLPPDFGEYGPGGSSSARFDNFVAGEQDDEDMDETSGPKGKKKKGSGEIGKANNEADFSGKDSYWGVGQEVYESLSPKSRKQLRNKIGARRFRERRKEYIVTLEARLAERDELIHDTRSRLENSFDAIKDLKERLAALEAA